MAIAQAAIALALAILVFTPKMDADGADRHWARMGIAPVTVAASSDLLLATSEQRK